MNKIWIVEVNYEEGERDWTPVVENEEGEYNTDVLPYFDNRESARKFQRRLKSESPFWFRFRVVPWSRYL